MKNSKKSWFERVGRRWAWLLVIVLALGVKFNTFGNEFVWDDFAFVLEWQEVRSVENVGALLSGNLPEGHQGSYRPVRSLLYLLTQQVFGTNPSGYHVMATVVHSLAALMVYLLASRLSKDRMVGLVAGCLFAVHPVGVEATTWITASFDAVGVLLALASVWLYLLCNGAKNRWLYVVSLGLAVAASFTNEVVLLLPGLIVVSDWLVSGVAGKTKLLEWAKARLIVWLPYGLVFGSYWWVRANTVGPAVGHQLVFSSFEQNIMLWLVMLVRYVGIVLWPSDPRIYYELIPGVSSFYYHDYNFEAVEASIGWGDLRVFLSLLVLLALGLVAWRNRKKRPEFVWALGWFGLALVPALPWFPYGVMFSERYLYLALVGPVVAVAVMLVEWMRKTRSRLIGLGLLIIVFLLASVSWQRNAVWKNGISLWRTELAKNPQSATLRTNLGFAYQRAGRVGMATELFESAVEINPNNVTNQQALVRAYIISGQHREALEALRYMLLLRPNYLPYLIQAGDAASRVGDNELAQEYYEKALELDPSNGYVEERLDR